MKNIGSNVGISLFIPLKNKTTITIKLWLFY
jgi:hypothetical protein